uniref:probable phospholipase A1 magnifin isoform X2 n=1 Tax=Vespula vulgaris TaxID=7454 RepID=UPI0021348DFE|nr:probable phospholipase A1 magnifin isoform X2 [Vespula vulgaris]
MNIKYLLLFLCFLQVSHYCYADDDLSLSNELDRGLLPNCSLTPQAISFILFTREIPNGIVLTQQNLTSVGIFKKSDISSNPVVFLIHGFLSCPNQTNFLDVTRALIKKDKYIVISIDWKDGACTKQPILKKCLGYFQSVENTRIVGKYIAHFSKRLIQEHKLSVAKVRLIGHSLGAHIAGFAGKEFQSFKLGKYPEIIGLDPAGPSFSSNKCSERLCETDADYVQIIHTSKYFGIGKTIGTVDFYMNNGTNQPDCSMPVDVCSHSKAVIYMAECIKHECCFIGIPRSKSSQRVSSCTKQECVCVGLNAKKYPSRGSFYVPVESTAPFCNNKGKII